MRSGRQAEGRRALTSSLGALLRDLRTAANLTQEELAERSGLSVHAIGLLERGLRRAPRTSTIEYLAGALRLDGAQRSALIAAARGAAGRTPPPALAPSVPLRLPSTPLIGRERELARVGRLLAQPAVRLVTLTGPPGSGKTRLAQAAAGALAHRYPDGAALVALAPLGGPALVMPAIQRALALPEVGGAPALEAVAGHCAARHLLLVLDNFEHVLEAGPEVTELLSRCAELQVLVTSRAALRVRGEHELPVPPLGPADAVALFVARAAAAEPSFRLTAENAGAVTAICRRLDGLPLALELAAPWVKLLTPAALAERLDRQLEMLVDGPRDLPERQQTLRAALAWSVELIKPEARVLLRRLAVFAGSAPVDGVEQVCQAAGELPGGVLRHLATLAEHSLIERDAPASIEPRVTMLESVREYGRELLAAAGEAEATELAHLDHYVRLAGDFRREIGTAAQAAWLERLGREHDNLRAALAWALAHRPDVGLRLASAAWLFWDYAGHRQEGLDWIERLLAAGSTGDPLLRARALHAAGRLAEEVGEYRLSIARHEESLAILRELGDRSGVAQGLRGLALTLAHRGEPERAVPLLEEAVALLRELDERGQLATALMNLGIAVAGQGDTRRQVALYEEALALHRDAGNALGEALCLINLAERARIDGELELARRRLDDAAAIARRAGSPYHQAAALANLGALARTSGDVETAAVRYRASLRLFVRIGERRGASVCLRWLAWAAWASGRAASAVRLYAAADALWPDVGVIEDPELAIHQRARAALREQLGEVRYAAAHDAGLDLTVDEAVAEASIPD